MTLFRSLGGALALSVAAAALAVPVARPGVSMANTQLADPVREAEARALMETLRCLTCQSQSIADSDADMAADMRHLVRSRMQAGESPEEIRAWLVERYGDYITYAPPVSGSNWLLYAIPAVILLIAIGLVVRRVGAGR